MPVSWRNGLPVLSGPRVTLRELAPEDAPTLLPTLSVPEVARYISAPPSSADRFAAFIEWGQRERAAGRYAAFALVPHGHVVPAGLLQLRLLNPQGHAAEWGFALGAHFWGAGLFVEAGRLLAEFAFETVGLHRLEARAAVDNARGQAAMRKLGAVQEGILRRIARDRRWRLPRPGPLVSAGRRLARVHTRRCRRPGALTEVTMHTETPQPFRFFAVLAGCALLAAPSLAGAAPPSKLDTQLQARASTGSGRSRVIVRVQSGGDGPGSVRRARGVPVASFRTIGAELADVSDADLAALAVDPDVVSVHADRPIAAMATGAERGSAASALHVDRSFDGTGVRVAVIDSGVAVHDDLSANSGASSRLRIAEAVDFVNGRRGSYDDYGHGTHVAGIIAGNGADSDGAYAGLAPGASIVSLKVLDGEGARHDQQRHRRDRIRPRQHGIGLNVRVINLSIGAPGSPNRPIPTRSTLAARAAVESGIVVVAAAGNFGKSPSGEAQYGAITAPGNAPWVLTVGAVKHDGHRHGRATTRWRRSARAGRRCVDMQSQAGPRRARFAHRVPGSRRKHARRPRARRISSPAPAATSRTSRSAARAWRRPR